VVGVLGLYVAIRPKFFKGPDKPGLGDMAYTEQVMFGY